MPRLDLDALDNFAAVANLRSFRAAAQRRGVSASTLSQSLRDLESRLGVRLLNRTTRSVAPTEAGARLLEQLRPALAAIGDAVDQVHAAAGEVAGALRINAPEPAIELVLRPMIPSFLKAHPRVRLEMVGESRMIDIVEAGYDAGVRWGESLARDMIAVPLSGPQRYAVVASPAFMQGRSIREPRDLLSVPCLRQRFPSGLVPLWEFERGDEVVRLDPAGPLISTSITLHRQAALEGVGVWSTFEDWAREDIDAGRLVRLLEDWQPSFPGPFLYYPSRRQPPAALRAFIDHVQAWRRSHI